jgi:hypothetical protein
MWQSYLRDVLGASHCKHSRNKSKLMLFFFYWYVVYVTVILLLLINEFVFIKRTDFIIPKEVLMNMADLDIYVIAPLSHYLLHLQVHNEKAHQIMGKHPSLNILTNKFYNMDFCEFSRNFELRCCIFYIFSPLTIHFTYIFWIIQNNKRIKKNKMNYIKWA